MKKVINFLFFAVCLNCVIIFSSCSNNKQNVAPVKIGINEWTGYDPLILADKIDLFNKNNVQVDIVR
jgi:hypothetical protein